MPNLFCAPRKHLELTEVSAVIDTCLAGCVHAGPGGQRQLARRSDLAPAAGNDQREPPVGE